MKQIFGIIFFVYVGLFAIDYVSIRFHMGPSDKTAKLCDKLLSQELWLIALMPGAGNACLDMGYLPLRKK